MGRKLSPLEAEAFTKDDTSPPNGKRSGSSPTGLNLQARIADALGLPVTALSRSNSLQDASSEAASEAQTAEIAMSRDCLDLIEAYTRITNLEERRRLLKIVRDAADVPVQ